MKITINIDEKIDETEIMINCNRLTVDIENIIATLRIINLQMLVIKDGENYLLDISDISYIEALERKTFVYTEDAIFELGNRGIAISTLLQFLCFSLIITVLKWVFFTDILIKKLSIHLRIIFMFAGVIVSVGVFAAVCHWFPVDEVVPWLMFLVCFLVCAAISVIVSVLKERSDNKKMQEALIRMMEEDL